MLSNIEQIYYGQTTGAEDSELTAADGKSYLYQNQQQLVNNLFSGTTEGYDVFSPSLLYNAVTTWALAESDPTAFHISAEDAEGLGAQIQSNIAAQLFGSMTPSQSSGVDVLGSLYASNGMLSLLETAPTYTFQAVA